MSNEVVVKRFQTSDLSVNCFFQMDGWFNATLAAKGFEKDPVKWTISDEVLEYGTALVKLLNLLNPTTEGLLNDIKNCQSDSAKRVKIPKFLKEVGLLKTKRGSPENGGGTWFHPKLGIMFARWLSADFAVWCDMEIETILRNRSNPQHQSPIVRIAYPIAWNEILGYNQLTEEGDVACKATRRTYDAFIKQELGLRDPRYIQELTNLVMVTFTGFTVADFRRGWGIRPGSRVRTRLFFNDHLRNATDQVEREVVDCARGRRVADFSVIKQIARDTAESLRLQYGAHALPLGECVVEEPHIRLVS